MSEEGSTAEYDVVIVGAGLSGLTAAHELLKQRPELKVCILEARKRMGGRLKTVFTAVGKQVDMGGSWVGPRQTNICQLLDEMHVKTHNQYLDGRNIHDDGHTLHTYTGTIPSISLLSLIDTHFMLGKLEKLVKTIDLKSPDLCQNADKWDGVSLFEFGQKSAWTKQAQSLLRVATRLILGYESEQVSLLYFLYYCATAGGTRPLLDSDGGGQDSRIEGGTLQLLSALSDDIEKSGCMITFDTVVQSIDYERSNIIFVTTRTGDAVTTQYRTRRLVMCIPPSCLSHVRFSPAPPPWKLSLWRRSQAGCFIKIIVFYKTAFWRNNGFSGSCVCENSDVADGRPLVGVFDYCDEDATKCSALCCFVCGNVGEDFSMLPSHQAKRDAVCTHLVKLFGEEAREECVTDFLIMDWLHDPDGSPAFGGGGCPVDISALGFFRKHVLQLRTPLMSSSNSGEIPSCVLLNGLEVGTEGKTNDGHESMARHAAIMFGGTETALQWDGYMDGAVESGIRVAKEALQSLE